MDGILTIGEHESFVQNSLELRAWRGVISIEVDNPWAGSTETGFGYTCHVDLTTDQARQVAAFLLAKADEIDASTPPTPTQP